MASSAEQISSLEKIPLPEKLQAIRGVHDILPQDIHRWQYVERKLQDILHAYGYHEIRLPIIEKTALFTHSIGQQTDIVSKEMYTFSDRNGDSLSLRPEGTASCVRAVLEHGLLRKRTKKFWYMGPMFRYERPQQGRQRQFYQLGVESFGLTGPDIDAEMILLGARLWREFGLKNITLQLNSLGNITARQQYREALVEYFSQQQEKLDKDSLQRLRVNPLRILDSKNSDMQDLINKAPMMLDYLDQESAEHFAQLQYILDEAGLKYHINPRLVRGLDYYGQTVFEWITDQLGAQNTVCAGGRYNDLVEHFCGKPTPALGFALGMERLMQLLVSQGHDIQQERLHVYFVMSAEKEVSAAGMRLAESLRDQLPWLRLMMHCGDVGFKTQFKHADKSGACFALILGSEELKNCTVGLKSLRDKSVQKSVAWNDIGTILTEYIKS